MIVPGRNNVVLALLGAVMVLACSATNARAGAALRFYYTKIPGLTVEELTKAPAFPHRPTGREPVTDRLEKITGSANDFGAWTRGYLEAPVTGEYTFWVSSDDHAEFHLSRDDTPLKLVQIVANRKYTVARDFDAKEEQRSKPVRLTKGEKYYFELLHKEAESVEHVSVAWKIPGGQREIIPATRLMPIPLDSSLQPTRQAPLFLDHYQKVPVSHLTNLTVTAGARVSLAVTVEAYPSVHLQWFRNLEPIPDADLSTFSFVATSNELFSVVASNALGMATVEAAVTVLPDRTAPEPMAALVTGPDELTVVFSEAVDPGTASDASNYAVDGTARVHKAALGNTPEMVVLKTSGFDLASKPMLHCFGVQDRATPPNSGNFSVQIERDLKVWLPFESAAGRTVRDLSGNRLDATLTDGAKLNANGRAGGCLGLAGMNYAQLPSGFDAMTNGFTITIWARATERKAWARLFDFGNGPKGDTVCLSRERNTDNLILSSFGPSYSGGRFVVQGMLRLNEWQHFVTTLDREGLCTIYLNGERLGSGKVPVPPVFNRKKNYVGSSNQGPIESFIGQLDEFRYYDRVLTEAEIKVLSSASMP